MSVRLLKLIIAASLLANVLLLGVAFGHMGRSLVGLECGKSVRHRVNVHELIAVLSEAQQKQLQPDIMKFDENEKQLEEKLTEGRLKVIAFAQAKPFDKAAYLTQVKALDDLHSEHATRIADMVAEIAQQCDDQERVEFDARLRAMMLDKPADENKPGNKS